MDFNPPENSLTRATLTISDSPLQEKETVFLDLLAVLKKHNLIDAETLAELSTKPINAFSVVHSENVAFKEEGGGSVFNVGATYRCSERNEYGEVTILHSGKQSIVYHNECTDEETAMMLNIEVEDDLDNLRLLLESKEREGSVVVSLKDMPNRSYTVQCCGNALKMETKDSQSKVVLSVDKFVEADAPTIWMLFNRPTLRIVK